MTKKGMVAAIACAFVVGLISGGAVVEVHYRSSAQQDRSLFENKLRCQALAKKYENDNRNFAALTVVLTVDYSQARHTCVAEIVRNESVISSYDVVDLGTKETLYASVCRTGADCNLRSAQDAAFKKAVASAASPY
jgi:hypothetical protein